MVIEVFARGELEQKEKDFKNIKKTYKSIHWSQDASKEAVDSHHDLVKIVETILGNGNCTCVFSPMAVTLFENVKAHNKSSFVKEQVVIIDSSTIFSNMMNHGIVITNESNPEQNTWISIDANSVFFI